MACGQKKQNTNEGGVHLTERTCSPYNPIIKQIVDDCLGLPIYPVTSIDAVIDEDGNTLRKLLDELLNEIKEGGTNVSDLIQEIQNIIDNLGDTYVTNAFLGEKLDELNDLYASKRLVENLKTLLWAISALSNTEANNENNLYASDGITPKIVSEINRLAAIVGEGGSLEDLESMVNSLRDLLLAVANFDTSEHSESGVEHYPHNNQIKIIKEILDIKTALGLDPENPGGGSLAQQIAQLRIDVDALIERVDALEEEAVTHAHLDPRVLDQMPIGISEQLQSHYKTLKISEYPPTTAKFLRDGTEKTVGEVVYYGFLPGKLTRDLNVYPFGHIDQTQGFPLFYKDSQGTYVPIRLDQNDPTSPQLRMGDSFVSGNDFVTLIQLIVKQDSTDVKFYEEPRTSLPSGIRYRDIYYNANGSYYVAGDLNGDHELVNVADLNWLTDVYINSQYPPNMQVPTNYHKDIAAGWLIYQQSATNVIMYPCIQGKVYVDQLTGSAFRYDNGTMFPVGLDVITGGPGIEVTRSLAYINNYEVANGDQIQEGPYNKYEVNISDNVLPNTVTCKYVEELDISNVSDYCLYEGKYQILPTLPIVDPSKIVIDQNNKTVTIKHDIVSVTSLLNFLLNGRELPVIHSFIPEKIQSLNDYLNRQLETCTTDEQRILIRNILEALNNPPEHSVTSQDAVTVFYIAKNGNEYVLETTSTSDSYYKRDALVAKWDFNKNGTVDINDATQLINLILYGSAESTYSLVDTNTEYPYLEPIALDAKIFKKINNNLVEVVPLDSSKEGHKMLTDGRLFRVVYDESSPLNCEWYYFDDFDTVRPLNPKYSLNYEDVSKHLILYQNGAQVSETSLKTSTPKQTINSISNYDSDYTIINLGKESTPYMFGETGDLNKCFLDENGNFETETEIALDLESISLDPTPSLNPVTSGGAGDKSIYTSFVPDCNDLMFDRDLIDYSLIDTLNKPFKYDFKEKVKEMILNKMSEMGEILAEAGNIKDRILALDDISDVEYETTHYCLDYRFETHINRGASECSLYRVREHIYITLNREALVELINNETYLFSSDIVPLWLTLDAKIKILDKVPIDDRVIYYFPKFGLQLRFEKNTINQEGTEYTVYVPIIVQVETKSAVEEHIIYQGSNCGVLLYPNEYAHLKEISTLYVDSSRLLHIPGYYHIDVSGKFTASVNNLSIVLLYNKQTGDRQSANRSINTTTNLQQIKFAELLPDIVAGHSYEYHVFDGIFSYIDVTPQSDEGSGGELKK